MSEHDRDILIARVADSEASEADWAAFKAHAERDPSMWRELAEMQRDALELTAAVNRAIAVADTVEAPMTEHAGARLTERFRAISLWGGWAAAAALVLMWSTGWRPGPTGSNTLTSGIGPNFSTPQEVLNEYLTRGREAGVVVDQAPEMVLLDARPVPEGNGFQVYYVRQIVEKAVVDDLYRLGIDEQGRGATVRFRVAPAGQGPF
jgi:hypothetical protein